MRGLTVVRTLGVTSAWLNGVIFRLGSRMTALTTALSSIARLSKSIKNEDFLFIGPLKFPPQNRCWYGALLVANGFRELMDSSLKFMNAWPRNLSVPGLVRISMRPKPRRSYSEEDGF